MLLKWNPSDCKNRKPKPSKNEDLQDEIAFRDETIEQLQFKIKQMQVEHQKQIQEVKQSYEAENRKQTEYIDKILRYFPYVEKLNADDKIPQQENGIQ